MVPEHAAEHTRLGSDRPRRREGLAAQAEQSSGGVPKYRHAHARSAAVGHNQNGAPYTRSANVCARSVCGGPGLATGAPASARGTSKREFQSRCRKAMHAEHADGDRAAAPHVTRRWQRVSVDIECMSDGLGATRKHQRVLRASPFCICVGFLSVLRRHSHPTHPFPAGCRKFIARRGDFER